MSSAAERRLELPITIRVPDSEYCHYRGMNRCSHLITQETQITWADGLGSPGTLRNYSCGAFLLSLAESEVPAPDKGWCIKKCPPCKKTSILFGKLERISKEGGA